MKLHVAILGGGVGGLTAAIALAQKGFEVDVYERAKQISEIGAGIVCWPNASFVFNELGLLEDILRVSGKPKKMQRYSHKGENLGALDIQYLNQLMGFDSYSILRKDLMKVLASHALKAGVNIHFSHTVDNIESIEGEASTCVQVVFKSARNEKKSIQADIILGAEGRMNSISRLYVNGNNKPVYQGFINWVGVFESDVDYFDEIAVSDYWGVGSRFGVVPVSRRRAYWAGGMISSEIKINHPEKYKNELLEIFQNWPEPIVDIINKTPNHAINKIYVHDHSPIPCWHKENVLLIGDAAHAPLPTSGQGACQAMEDALVLSRVLSEMLGKQKIDQVLNLDEIFNRFTERRMTKTTGIIMGGRQFAESLFNIDEKYCKQRNVKSQKTNFTEVAKAMAKGWGVGF